MWCIIRDEEPSPHDLPLESTCMVLKRNYVPKTSDVSTLTARSAKVKISNQYKYIYNAAWKVKFFTIESLATISSHIL